MPFFKDLIASGKAVSVKDYVAPVVEAEDSEAMPVATEAPTITPDTDSRFPTVKAFDKGADFKPAKTTYSVVKDNISNVAANPFGESRPQYQFTDTGEPLTYEQAAAALNEAIETTVLEQIGEPVNLNKELKDFGLSFDISRSDDPMEVYKKIEKSYPKAEGYNVKAVDYSGNQDWIYLLKGPKDDEWYPVNKPGVSLSDVGTVAGAVANEGTAAAAAASVATGGLALPVRMLAVSGIEGLGAYLRENIEKYRGFQTATQAEMGETALKEGLIGGVMEGPTSLLLGARDISRGALGILSPSAEGVRAMEIAKERGYRHLTPGMLGGIARIMEKQKAAFAPEIAQRTYQQFQEELSGDLKKMIQENTSKGMSTGNIQALHDEMIDAIYTEAKTNKVNVVGLGEAVQQAFNEGFLQTQSLKFASQIKDVYASAKGEVSFDLEPVKDIANAIKNSGVRTRQAPQTVTVAVNPATNLPITETVTDEVGKIPVGAQDQLISPAMEKTLEKLSNIDANVRDLDGISAVEQLHALRKEFDQFAWETSDAVTSADRRLAKQVRGAITDTLMKTEGGGEIFQQQFKKFNEDYTAFAEVRDFSQLQKLVETDNPAEIADSIISAPTDAARGKMLKYLSASLPEKDFNVVKDAARDSLITSGNLADLPQRLAQLEDNPVVKDLLFTPREFADFKTLALRADVLSLPKVQNAIKKTSDNVELGQKLIDELTLPEFEALASKGGEPFRATLKAGFIAKLWEKSQATKTILVGGKEVTTLDNQAFGETVAEYMNDVTPKGKIFSALFSETERKELSDIQFWSQVVGSVNTDSGAILTAAAKVAKLGAANLISNPSEFVGTLAETQTAKFTASTWFSEKFSKYVFGGEGPKAWSTDKKVRGILTGLNSGLSKLPLSDQFMTEDKIPEELKDKIKKIRQSGQTVTPTQQQQPSGPVSLTPEDKKFFEGIKKNLTPVNTKVKYTPLSSTYSEDITTMSQQDSIISNELTGGSSVTPNTNKGQSFDDIISNELTGPSTVVPIDGAPTSKFLDMQGVFDKERLFSSGVPVEPELGNRILEASPELGEYMIKSMKLESAGGTDTTGAIASGYFQFVPETWPSYAKKAGVKQMSAKKATLEEQVKVMEAFTKSNADTLKNFLGREPSHGELYLAHHFGASGSKELIKAARSTPNKPVKALVSKDAYNSNKALLSGKSAGELVRYLELSFRRGQFAKNHSLERQIASLR